MTSPTKAQIGAAAQALSKADDNTYRNAHYINLAEAALTAAAGVTAPTQAQIDAAAKAIQDGFPSFEADAEAAQQVANVALTAAAGVGDQKLRDAILDRNAHLQRAERAVADTIERCALVADEYKRLEPRQAVIATEIAAHIRALQTEGK
jgi:hypothetical protein